MMVCVACGRTARANPIFKSNWRAIDLDEYRFYACPSEFPNGKAATVADFQVAYEVVVACCLSEILKIQGKEPCDKVVAYQAQRRSNVTGET